MARPKKHQDRALTIDLIKILCRCTLGCRWAKKAFLPCSEGRAGAEDLAPRPFTIGTAHCMLDEVPMNVILSDQMDEFWMIARF